MNSNDIEDEGVVFTVVNYVLQTNLQNDLNPLIINKGVAIHYRTNEAPAIRKMIALSQS